MEVSVIKIGNSKGIRLPKAILQKYDIKDTVDLELKEDHIEIRSKRKPRQDWEASFKEMINDEHEEVMIPDF